MKMMNNLNNFKGFSLLEILVTISIMAALAAAIAPVLMTQASEAKVKHAVNDLEMIGTAIKQFYDDTGYLPPSLPALVTRDFPANDACGNLIDWNLYPAERWRGPYLTVQNFDPAGLPVLQDGWGEPYVYHPDNDGDCTNLDELSFNPAIGGIHALVYSTGVKAQSITGGDGTAATPFALNDDDGDSASDEDPNDGLDNDADGSIDEDPPNTARSANFYRFVSIVPEINDKISLTTQRLNTLEAAIKTFYRDTGRMPPTLEALISLNVPYDNDFNGSIGAGEVIDPLSYPKWQGPYMPGGLPLTENPAFLDGWGQRMTLMVFVDGKTPLPPQGLLFDLDNRNDVGNPLQRYQALLLSAGRNLQFDVIGSGRNDALSFDNDGDGTTDEDPLNGLDDDGDGRFDEDPDETLVVMGPNGIIGLVLIDENGDGDDDGGPTSDFEAPDPFRLISIRDDIGGKTARTRDMLAILNDAANRYDTQLPFSNNDDDGDGSTDEDPLDGIDNDGDISTDEDQGGFENLDAQEALLLGNAFILLKNQGYVGGSYQDDPWGNKVAWDSGAKQFYSYGRDGTDATGDEVF